VPCQEPAPPSSTNAIYWGPAAARAIETSNVQNARYWHGILQTGPENIAENLRTRAGIVTCDGAFWPLTRDDEYIGNSYPCSLYTQYVRYPRAELKLVPPGIPRSAAKAGLGFLAALLRLADVDRVVQWSSWLLSTNLHQDGLPQAVESVTRTLVREYPSHAVLIKNIHTYGDRSAVEALVRAGYDLVTSRMVYFFDGRNSEYLSKETVRRDIRAMTKCSAYQVVEHDEFLAADVPRIASLYRQLYIQKHSDLNPRYTEAFVANALRERWLEFRGLRHRSGDLHGVYATFSRPGIITAPFVGYDISIPAEVGLYRRLVTLLLLRVANQGCVLNYSSGAGEFKRRRGGQAVVEFNALYTRHLPPSRRIGFAFLRHAANRYGRPFLERQGI